MTTAPSTVSPELRPKGLPSEFRCQSAADFIGPARQTALYLESLVAAATPTGAPIKLLILGAPGIGKSDLAAHLVRAIQCDKWSFQKFNGIQLKLETVETLAQSFQLSNLFGGYRVIQIEEVDKVPTVAQVRFLTILDDLPKRTAVVATSNCEKDELEFRFQRRFEYFGLTPPTAAEIHQFLQSRFQLRPQDGTAIAEFACGSVGQALMDANGASILAGQPRFQKAA